LLTIVENWVWLDYLDNIEWIGWQLVEMFLKQWAWESSKVRKMQGEASSFWQRIWASTWAPCWEVKSHSWQP
jgi:hypothetical protein